MPGLGGGPWISNTLSPSPCGEDQTPCFPSAFGLHALFLLRVWGEQPSHLHANLRETPVPPYPGPPA